MSLADAIIQPKSKEAGSGFDQWAQNPVKANP
jgi:hypothetical protein